METSRLTLELGATTDHILMICFEVCTKRLASTTRFLDEAIQRGDEIPFLPELRALAETDTANLEAVKTEVERRMSGS